MRRLALASVVSLSCLLAVGCGGESFVEGTLRLGALSPDDTGYAFAELRAFPEHPEGFVVTRPYRGDEALVESVLLSSTDMPVNFRLEGYDVGDPGGPWRIVAWLTNREESEWVGTNEPYGSRRFEWDCENGPVCAIRGVEVDIDRVAPPQ